MDPEQKEHLDRLMEEIDEDQIAKGDPPLSVVITHDDGTPSTASLNTIRKYKLQREGETLEQTVDRLREEACAYARSGKALA